MHAVWTDGPHDHDCVICRRPIIWGDLWRNIDGDPTRPVHSQCIRERRYDTEKVVNKRPSWATGFGKLLGE